MYECSMRTQHVEIIHPTQGCASVAHDHDTLHHVVHIVAGQCHDLGAQWVWWGWILENEVMQLVQIHLVHCPQGGGATHVLVAQPPTTSAGHAVLCVSIFLVLGTCVCVDVCIPAVCDHLHTHANVLWSILSIPSFSCL